MNIKEEELEKLFESDPVKEVVLNPTITGHEVFSNYMKELNKK